MSELIFFLFAKKICPICGSKLERIKDFKIKTNLFEEEGVKTIFHPGQEVKCYFYFYQCNNCGFKKSLSDIVNKL